MKKILLLATCLFFIQSSFGQENYSEKFLQFCKTGDTVAQREILAQWQQEDPDNPELYTSYFNYYFSKSREEVIHFTDDPGDGRSLKVMDSTNNVQTFMTSKIIYHDTTLDMGFEYIDKGIVKFPDRLDMRFGKIYALGQQEDWKAFTEEIIMTIEHSAKNDNQWLWTNNQKSDTSKGHFLSGIQDYQVQLFETQDNKLLDNMRSIAEKVLQYYPDHVESLSNISVSYLLTKQYEKALEPLLKAEKINPKDYIVIGNIAFAYMNMGDKEKAIAYYEKNLKIGDENTKDFARKQIEKLRK